MAPAKLVIKESSLHPCFKQLASTLHISQNIGVKKAEKQTNQPTPPTLPFLKQTCYPQTVQQLGWSSVSGMPLPDLWTHRERQTRGLKCQEALPATRRSHPASRPAQQQRFPPNPMVSQASRYTSMGGLLFFVLLSGKLCIALNANTSTI